MELNTKSSWESLRPLLIIVTVYLLHLSAGTGFYSLSILLLRSFGLEQPFPGSIFSFSGFIFSLMLLLFFLGTMRLSEKVIFKESLLPHAYQRHKEMGREILLGLATGPVLFSLLFLVFFCVNWLTVSGTVFPKPFSPARTALYWAIPVLLVMAVYEELLVRGFFLSFLKKYYGAPVGIAFSALIFSLLHVYNPHLNEAGLIGILLAGAWLGLAYEVTDSLYFPTALHFSWNLAQTLLGFPVSGLDTPHLIEARISGPPFWTGGNFGPEAGMAGYLLIGIGIAIVLLYGKKKQRASS
ncbi:MAG TPA: CPBP family intramembrane metalloprotease [Firmicutes bacterium]|jgi:membrane protease YdiL (CAAX protease family)|nr:CPBP family intramembrane metalloprotease [Bacillota bacterium]